MDFNFWFFFSEKKNDAVSKTQDLTHAKVKALEFLNYKKKQSFLLTVPITRAILLYTTG